METKSAPLSKNPGGYCWEFLVGGAALFSKSWPYFRRKNVIFHTRFQTWGLFLESAGNFTGAKSNIQIEI